MDAYSSPFCVCVCVQVSLAETAEAIQAVWVENDVSVP